jgi:hypothetical protein
MTTQGGLTDYIEFTYITLSLKSPATFKTGNRYMHLYTSDPTDAVSGGTEVSGGGYVATLCPAFTESQLDYPSKFINSASIVFPEATADWGHITHAAIWSSQNTAGTKLFRAEFTEHKDINEGDTFIIPESGFRMVLAGAWGDEHIPTWKQKLLSAYLNNSGQNYNSFPNPDSYVALFNQAGVEISGNNYARMRITRNWSSPVAPDNHVHNTVVLSSNQASNDWGYIAAVGIYGVTGDLLLYGSLDEVQYVGKGDKFRFDLSALTVYPDWV